MRVFCLNLITDLLILIIMQSSAKALGARVLEDRQSIKSFLANNNPIFNQKIEAATKKNYSRLQQLGIFKHRNEPSPHIFYFDAGKYNSDEREEVQEYILKELHHFYSNYDCSYSIAYIHSSFVDFLVFRKFVERWPEHFFYRLRRIYIIGASIMVKIIETFSFGTFSHLCDQLFLNLDDEADLVESDHRLLKALGESTSTPIFTPNKSSIRIIQSELYGKILQQYDLYLGKYPIIILRLLYRLVRSPQQLKLQGIFRKSCDSQQLQRLQKQLQAKNWQAIDKQKDVLIVCGCLKKIMNNLKLPLFDYKIYDQVIAYSGGDETVFIKGILKQMDYVNSKVFILLIVFLTEFVIGQKQQNKMNSYNLSVVFGPCFFRPKEYDLKDLINSGKYAKILMSCFDNQANLFEEGERNLAHGILKSLAEGSLNLD